VRKPTKPDPRNITDDADDDVHPEDWAAAAGCVDWLANRTRPNFFLHCSLNIPHPSFATNATWLGRVRDAAIGDVRDDWAPVGDMHPYHAYASVAKGVGADDFSRDDVRKIQKTYYAMCAEADYLMGTIGAAAKKFWDDTLVVFASDHGEMAMEHRQVWKNAMYEASARVPLVLAGGALPPRLARGSVDDRVASLLDVFPTVADFLGVRDPHRPLPGVALRGASLLSGPRRDYVVSQYHSNLAPTAAFMAVSRKPRENPGVFDCGGPYLGQFGSDSATSWTVDHLCTSSRDLDTKIARIDSYNVMLK
jgi:arylsulfatase K